jgi:carboxyl-terminal processing protease
LDSGIAYVNVAALGGNVSRDLAAFLKQVEGQTLTGMILDLRNNPGGYLDAAIEMAGYFITDGVIVSERSHGATTSWSYANNGQQLLIDGPDGKRVADVRNHTMAPGVPLVVLVNRGTASAAEVLAAALQDHGRGVLAGEPTYGKGSVTGDFDLSGGARVHLTIGQWQSPKGRSVAGRGLTPDIVVAASGLPDPAIAEATKYIAAHQ